MPALRSASVAALALVAWAAVSPVQAIGCYQCGDAENGFRCVDSNNGIDGVYGECDTSAGLFVACAERRREDDNSLSKGCYIICATLGREATNGSEPVKGEFVPIKKVLDHPVKEETSIMDYLFPKMMSRSDMESKINQVVGTMHGGCLNYEGGFDCFCRTNGCNDDCPYSCPKQAMPPILPSIPGPTTSTPSA